METTVEVTLRFRYSIDMESAAYKGFGSLANAVAYDRQMMQQDPAEIVSTADVEVTVEPVP
jgi:hypothetical protein